MFTAKTWGFEDEIVNLDYCGKRMFVKEQHHCSIHMHKEKDEVLMVGNDDGVLYFESGRNPDDMTGIYMQANDRIRVEPGTWHRFTALRDTYIFEFSTHHKDEDSYRHIQSGKWTNDEFGAMLQSFFKDQSRDKILTIQAAKAISAAIRAEGRSVGMCNGCFDLMHLGHVSLLADAKDRCEVLFVCVNSDESVSRLKGEGRPFVDQRGRMGMLASNRYVDYVVLCDGDTCVEAAKAISPNIYVTTSEYGVSGPEAKAVVASGGKAEAVGMISGYNTTELSHKVIQSQARKE